MTTQFMRNYIDLINEMKQPQPQQLDEGAAETIAALIKKIPGIGRYIELAQQYKPQLVQILKTSKSGEEVKKKMEDLVAQASVPVSESGLMKQLGGTAAMVGSVLSVAMMNYVGMIEGLFQRAADGEMGTAIAAGAYLGVVPVGLMIIGTMLMFEGDKEQNDAQRKADLQKQNDAKRKADLQKQQGLGEADSGPADIGQIAASLKFLPTTKLARKYQFVANGVPGRMPAMTYTVAAQEQPVVTVTSDGKETQNVAAVNDIIMSGPSQENYVVKAAKFPKLYQGAVGKTVIPEQSPRMVALYRGPQAVTFTAPWGESMVLKPGDYLVKDGDAGYYRIARVEFEQTYNEPKQSVAEAIPTIRGTPKAQPSADYTGEDLVRDANALFTAGGFKLADKEVEPRVDNPKKINTTYYWRKKIKGLTPAQGQVQQLMIEIYNYAPKRTYWAINDWANDGARVTPELAQKLWSLMERTIKDSIDTAERENYWYSMIGNGKKPKGLEEEGMTEQELDELTRRDFLRGAGAALGGAALAGVAGQTQAAAPGSSGTKPTAEFSTTSPLYKVMTIRAICQAEAQGHRRVAGDKPDAFDLTVQKPPYFTGWFDPATIAKAEKVSVNALTNFNRKINPAEYKEYLNLQFEAYRTVDGAYRSFAGKDKKRAAESMAFYEPIYKSLIQNAEQLANKLNQYTAEIYGQKTGLEEEVDEAATPDAVKRIEELIKYK